MSTINFICVYVNMYFIYVYVRDICYIYIYIYLQICTYIFIYTCMCIYISSMYTHLLV